MIALNLSMDYECMRSVRHVFSGIRVVLYEIYLQSFNFDRRKFPSIA